MKLIRFVPVAIAIGLLSGCRAQEEPERGLAKPAVKLQHDKVPLGSPLDITYTFVVAPDAPKFTEAYRVFVGFVDSDDQLMWADDHYPSIPTTEWKPNQTVTYTRTVFMPIYPYVGEASIHMGLYSMQTQKRLPLEGEHVGQHAYKVARLQLQPQTENIFTHFKDGWHPAEVAEHNSLVEWQWTKKSATLAFKNPKKDSTFFLDLDNPSGVFSDPQQVTISIGNAVITTFPLPPKEQLLKKMPLTAAQLGAGDMVELKIDVDRTFVPAQALASTSKDPRELGVRVFHVFVQPAT
jgi:hypothetical protein